MQAAATGGAVVAATGGAVMSSSGCASLTQKVSGGGYAPGATSPSAYVRCVPPASGPKRNTSPPLATNPCTASGPATTSARDSGSPATAPVKYAASGIATRCGPSLSITSTRVCG